MTERQRARLLALPALERLALAELLWNSVRPVEEAQFLAIPDWQQQILSERLVDLEQNPLDEQTWEAVKAELWPSH